MQGATPEEGKRLKDKDDAQVIDKNFKFARIWMIDVTTKRLEQPPPRGDDP